jgi:arylsulfatase A-like enzyme
VLRLMTSFVLTFTLLLSSSTLVSAAKRPNIIVMLADDMGFSDIGCYGGEIDTPNLNGLAEGGLRFTQFYNTGRCCPTRACLLSGLYPHQAGVGWMMTDRGFDGYRGDLNRSCVTIAEALQPAGYSTYAIGKWHVTPHIKPEGPKYNWPRQRGFDHYYGTITGAGSFFDPGTLTRENTSISPFSDSEYQPEQYYYTDAISDHAVRFIDGHCSSDTKEKPFFMYVAYTAAHWPMHALQKDIDKYKGKYDKGYKATREKRAQRVVDLGLVDKDWDLSPQVGDWESYEHKEWDARNMEVYAAMVDNMDQGIGRIVGALKKHKQLDNTLILYMQDNGGCQEGNGRRGNFKRPVAASLPKIAADALRQDVIPRQNRAGVPTLTGPGIMAGPEDTYIAYGINWANVSNTPFREYKHFVHEGGVSTPLIAHWPSGIKRSGQLESQPGHLIDVMATCVDLAQAKYPAKYKDQAIKPMEGVSLAPAFGGKSLGRSNPIFWEHEGNRAIRDGDWKLVAKFNRPWELYNLKNDRTEMHDLSVKMPEVAKKLEAKWDEYAARANVLPLGGFKGKQATVNRKQRSFSLKSGDSLTGEKGPFVQKRNLEIKATIKKFGDNGVIVAQGGDAHGYALYVEDGAVFFCTCHNGKVTIVPAGRPKNDKDNVVIRVTLKGKTVTITVDGKQTAKSKVPGTLTQHPIDGLQVGSDTGGSVGNYDSPFKFNGEIEAVEIELPAGGKK